MLVDTFVDTELRCMEPTEPSRWWVVASVLTHFVQWAGPFKKPIGNLAQNSFNFEVFRSLPLLWTKWKTEIQVYPGDPYTRNVGSKKTFYAAHPFFSTPLVPQVNILDWKSRRLSLATSSYSHSVQVTGKLSQAEAGNPWCSARIFQVSYQCHPVLLVLSHCYAVQNPFPLGFKRRS